MIKVTAQKLLLRLSERPEFMEVFGHAARAQGSESGLNAILLCCKNSEPMVKRIAMGLLDTVFRKGEGVVPTAGQATSASLMLLIVVR